MPNLYWFGKKEILTADLDEKIFRTTNAQTSIRDKVIEETKIFDNEGLFSIEYVPIKGKNAGKITKYFYKDKNLVAWLEDVVMIEKDKIYKLDSETKDSAGKGWAKLSNYKFLMAVKRDDQGRDIKDQMKELLK
ncbi:MAG: hypothetical protein IJ728_02320 [Selenomonadaceae bacterium]|nr:hypothetical protein [Selenomonadaceae bacterium]